MQMLGGQQQSQNHHTSNPQKIPSMPYTAQQQDDTRFDDSIPF